MSVLVANLLVTNLPTVNLPAVQLEGITKTFPGVNALTDVSFDVLSGEVHALMGENGAGKSTMMKVLAGVYQPDGGSIRVGDRKSTRLNSSHRNTSRMPSSA